MTKRVGKTLEIHFMKSRGNNAKLLVYHGVTSKKKKTSKKEVEFASECVLILLIIALCSCSEM